MGTHPAYFVCPVSCGFNIFKRALRGWQNMLDALAWPSGPVSGNHSMCKENTGSSCKENTPIRSCKEGPHRHNQDKRMLNIAGKRAGYLGYLL